MICVNKIFVKKNIIASLTLIFLAGCASTTENPDDPLKYSRKLIREGHSDLYNNGAFQIPQTQIKIIPAGEKPIELAKEMMGMRARQAFLTSVKNAADSIYIIPEGSQLSLEYAKSMQQGSSNIGENITDVTRGSGIYLIKRSAKFSKDMVLESWQFGKEVASDINTYGIEISQGALQTGSDVTEVLSQAGTSTMSRSYEKARSLSTESTAGAKKSLSYASNTFIKGYAAVPEKMSERGHDIAEAASGENFSSGWQQSLEFRSEYSQKMTDLFGQTVSNYASDVSASFKQAGKALTEDVKETGVGLGLIRASRWVLQGVLWDGLIEPISKLGTASVGYVAVNFTAFPVMVVIQEGKAVTNLAIQVTWNTAGGVYDVVAPSAKAAVASVYSVFQISGGHLAAGLTATGGTILGATEVASGYVAGTTVKGVGYVSGKTVQYIGVPIAAAGVTLGSGAVGVVAGGAGVVTGSTLVVAGETTSIGTQAVGTVIAGTTVVAGTTASVAASATVGVYELSKAVIVPAGYELGGGIVLGYGTTSQLAAHSVLAVSDASYLVLSLEGPRWVIYSVKGNLGNGDDLPPGTIVDLEAMQTNGEEFQYLPVSQEEMQAVVESVYNELPTAPQANLTTEQQ